MGVCYVLSFGAGVGGGAGEEGEVAVLPEVVKLFGGKEVEDADFGLHVLEVGGQPVEVVDEAVFVYPYIHVFLIAEESAYEPVRLAHFGLEALVVLIIRPFVVVEGARFRALIVHEHHSALARFHRHFEARVDVAQALYEVEHRVCAAHHCSGCCCHFGTVGEDSGVVLGHAVANTTVLAGAQRRELASASACFLPDSVELQAELFSLRGESTCIVGFGEHIHYALVVVVVDKVSRAMAAIVTCIERLVAFWSLGIGVDAVGGICEVYAGGALGHGLDFGAGIAGAELESQR